MHYDPLNLLVDIIEYTDIQLSDCSDGTFATSIIETYHYQPDECSSTCYYDCKEELTLHEFLINLYFTLNSFHSEIYISFKFGDQYIHLYIIQLGDIWEKSTFIDYISHFNEFRFGKHKPTNITVKCMYEDKYID